MSQDLYLWRRHKADPYARAPGGSRDPSRPLVVLGNLPDTHGIFEYGKSQGGSNERNAT